ncbi:MAG: O-methyltransferase [Bacteroidales bacterium]|nr:O-methyltransferase [Bacteroidales bacterium]
MMNIDPALEKYILDHTEPETEVLKELSRQTHVHIYHPRMLSGHLQGKVLKMLCRMIKPVNVLEIGTYTGYSAICMAEGIPENGKIHTIEINDELEEFVKPFIKKAGFENKIKLYYGDALEIIPSMKLKFDLVFVDGDKKQYTEYYNLVFDMVNKGGYIIADNVLWDGKVLEDPGKTDEQTRGIMKFNELVQNDPRVENALFPIRDGIMVMRKK